MRRTAWGLVLLAASISMAAPVRSASDGAESPETENAFVEKKFLLLPASSDFGKAERLARRVADRLHLPLGHTKVSPNEETGLTFTKETCTSSGEPYPCYQERGRYDDGLYVSIELARPYLPDEPSVYVIVMASGLPEGAYADFVVTSARRHFPGARVVSSKVWMGCVH
jgi:hypothetical protein